MKKTFILTMIISALLMGCGNKEEKKQEEAQSGVTALQQLADKAKAMQDREAVDPIDFRKLKELLPESLSGFKRTEISGEKQGAMGFTVSRAEARYTSDDNATVKLEILDTGGIAGVASMALAAWTMAEIDKETESGYEKTTKYDGHKAFEKYDSQNKNGELNVLVSDRYVVNIHGDNITIDQLKDVLKDFDLNKLSELK